MMGILGSDMKKEKKFLKLLFLFSMLLFVADRIDNYLIRKEIKEYVFNEGGLELSVKYQCEKLKYFSLWKVNGVYDPNDVWPTPAVFCFNTDVVDVESLKISDHHPMVWNVWFHMKPDVKEHWEESMRVYRR